MKVEFIAGFGPIVAEVEESRTFWEGGLGIELEEAAPSYFATDDLEGVKAFALWPLTQASQSCFGTDTWPPDLPVPNTWLELDVATAEAVGEAVEELRGRGLRLIKEAFVEPWGQTTARLLSPEGILVGLTYTPWMHGEGGD